MIFTCTCVLELLGWFLLLLVSLKTEIINWVNYIKIGWWKGITSQWCSAEWLGEMRKLNICLPEACEMIRYWSTKVKAKISWSIMRGNDRRDQRCPQGNVRTIQGFSVLLRIALLNLEMFIQVKMFKHKVNWSLLNILSLKLVRHTSSFVQWTRKARYFWKLPQAQPQI